MGSSGINNTVATMKTCSKCGESKSREEFHKYKSSKDGVKSHCKECVSDSMKKYHKKNPEKRKAYQNSSKGAATQILTSMKYRCKKKGFPPPEFTVEEIIDKIENGRCEVTGRKFDITYESKYFRNPFSISPDRIDSFTGYTKENVRWVMVWVNLATQQYDLNDFKKWIKGVKW